MPINSKQLLELVPQRPDNDMTITTSHKLSP
jgi:hypothetical protein